MKTCQECRRTFKSLTCYNNHLETPEITSRLRGTGKRSRMPSSHNESLCERLRRCTECGRAVPRGKLTPPHRHACGERWCKICHHKIKISDHKTHQCFMQPVRDETGKKTKATSISGDEEVLLPNETKEESNRDDDEENESTEEESSNAKKARTSKTKKTTPRFLFWDFECTQQDRIAEKKVKESGVEYSLGHIYEHKPNYCVSRKVCFDCKDYWLATCEDKKCIGHDCEKCVSERPECSTCGTHYKRFMGESCREKFCDYLFTAEHDGTIAIAHNAKVKFPSQNNGRYALFIYPR